jgi:predicted RND superfamily exporter protein
VDLKTLNDDAISKRYRRRFALGVLALLLLSFPAAVHSFVAISSLFNRPADWIPEEMPVRMEFDDFARRFAVSDLVMLAWDGAVLGSEELEAVAQLLAPLCEQTDASPDQPNRQLGILPEAKAAIGSVKASLPDTPLHWTRSGTEILDRMTQSPTSLPRSAAIKRLTGSIVGPDGKQTCLVLSLNETGSTHRRTLFLGICEAIAMQLDTDPQAISMTGGPHDGALIDMASIRSVRTFSPPSAIVAGIICFFCLRSIALTLVITLVAVIGEGFVLAAVHYSGSPMNAVLIVLPPLVFVLTVSSGIHLSNYYLDSLAEFPHATRAQAAAIAMRAGTVPCMLASATTVVGLGSLTLVRLEPIQIFGWVSTLGLLASLGLLLLLLPGTMMLYGGPQQANDKQLLRGNATDDNSSWLSRQMRFLLRQCLEYPRLVIAVFLITTLSLSTGLMKLNTSVNVHRMFDATHPLRVQYDWFEQNIGPTINGELLLRFPQQSLASDAIDRLTLVREAHVAVARSQDVGGVLSAVSFLPAIPKGKGIADTASRSVIRSQLVDPESAVGKLGYLSRDEVAEVWRISFRLPMTIKSDFSREIEEVGATVDKALDAALAEQRASSLTTPEIVLTGGVKIAQEAQEILLRDLFRSFVSAFGVVAIVMMFLLRSVIGGLIAMIPNLFPTLCLFGYMGIIDKPLDIGSVMTASVALGIAVDDTIHLLSRFGSRTARGMRRKRAAWGALQQCGMAMFHTTLVCGLSLLVYSFSDFVPTRHFAYLMFGLLAAALLGDLLFLPALMVSPLGRYLARPAMADPGAELSSDEDEMTPIDVRRLSPAISPRNRVASKQQ